MLKKRSYGIIVLGALGSLGAGISVVLLAPYPRYREAKDAAEFARIGRQIVSYLDAHSNGVPSNIAELTAAKGIGVEDEDFMNKKHILYIPPTPEDGSNAVILVYPHRKGTSDRMVIDRRGECYWQFAAP